MEATIACSAGGLAGLAAFYHLARPHFSVRVNCHFCNQNARVPYSQSNSFHCAHCDQYNGWDSAGDYNRQLGLGDQSVRFVREQVQESAQGNGLCRNCNLNQELKVSQLARFSKDGQELEEYKEHLEKVYRLCAECEDVVATKLGDQDRKLANKLIEFRLERSRLNTSHSLSNRTRSRSWLPFIQSILAIAIFTLLQDYTQFQLPQPVSNITMSMQMLFNSYLDTMVPFVTITEVVLPLYEMLNLSTIIVTIIIAMLLLSFFNKALFSIIFYTILLLSYYFSAPHILQLTLAGVGVIIAVASTPPTPSNTRISSHGGAKLDVKFHQYQHRENTEDTLTQDLLDTSSGCPSDTPPCSSSYHLATPITPTPFATPTPPPNTLMRTRDESSFTHEFATQHEEWDCDLSSLSLGETPTRSNTVSPFSLSNYSSSSPTNSIFSPSRPLLHPARLTNTSWIAGGYWTPPGQTQIASPSRSSSHSSGFVSGTPSLANYPSPAASLNNFGSTFPTPYSLPAYNQDTERFSVLSEPVYSYQLPPTRHYAPRSRAPQGQDDCVSDRSLGRHSQVSQTSQTSSPHPQTKAGWSLTITLTPTGIILATSIAVNVALAVMWLRQGVEGT